ncbi:3-oxo-5-alpha-steroid 4-dehydrogenase 1-like [Branchiostoma floridae]|uniref:3-oxo-5alpha-steroid 4-dehydrogenase (NADP(+)) n=1 Tax=Branchiostoma floridae TaxID=7739 RepID=A0A9J7LLL7_BRAFL|nr:3-oxo-5-alpha-steroid 4-dehydrogenase 1-like [Branchiostoma floridae]
MPGSLELPGDELVLLDYLAYGMIAVSIPTCFLLTFVTTALYGRNSTQFIVPGFLPARVAWVIQELPAFVVPCLLLLTTQADRIGYLPNRLLLALYMVHYFHRSLIFPMLIRGGKPTPLVPFLLALLFCVYNGYMQARYLSQYARYPDGWLTDPRFIVGILMFAVGMAINIHSDHILRNLRKPGETGYKIPQGGMFTYVSGANFFGETLEWAGFAVACWSLQAVAFATFTALNVGPRAFTHHKWYLQKFDNYPKDRAAIVPFLL